MTSPQRRRRTAGSILAAAGILLVLGIESRSHRGAVPDPQISAAAGERAVPGGCPGLEPPGAEPELFLPGLISGPQHDYVVRFDPRADELLLMRSDFEFRTVILRYRCREGLWLEEGPAPIPFAGSIAYPAFSLDGRELVFDGAEAGGAPDLWRSTRLGEAWSAPARLGPEVNGPSVEMLASLAADGDLYFSSNRPGGRGSFDLYTARKTPRGYAPAENLGPAVNTAAFESHPFIAPDESFLLFDARRSDGLGSNDLYVSFRTSDGSWTAARNLGPKINTAAGEMRPYIAPGGKALFFCSDRPPGTAGGGGQDIWRVDASWIGKFRSEEIQK